MQNKIHIIAEAGTNHNGKVEKAKALIDIAKRSNANSVKFQIINPWGLYLPGEYSYGHYDIKKVIKIREDSKLKDSEYETLFSYAAEKGIALSASVFDLPGLDLLTRFNPPYIKIASCDLNNVRFLRQVAERGKKMILSTGMSSLSDIEYSVNAIVKTGFQDIVLMHCVSVYPAKLSMTNLNFIDVLKTTFGFPVGFSDHTGDSIAACMALTKGATWFEKHYTEDKTQEGFDHAYALEESEFKEYTEALANAQQAITSAPVKLGADEMYTRKRARRSLYAARNIEAGETLTDADILIVRPEGELDANAIDKIVGTKVKVPVKQYQALSFKLLDFAS
ncbi:MAG: N-acetylneuraminate synthase family protein [Bacteroidota bacterium]